MASTNKLWYSKRLKSHANTFGATLDANNISDILLTVYPVKKGVVLGVMLITTNSKASIILNKDSCEHTD